MVLFMTNFFSYHFKNNVVIILLLFIAIVILLYNYVVPAKIEQPKPVVYYVSDELHFASIPDAIEQEHYTGKVIIDKNVLRSKFLIPKLLRDPKFVSMSFIVPGVSGLDDSMKYFATPELNRRDDHIVGVFNIVPWSKEDYAHNPPEARDRRTTWRRTSDYWLKHPPKEMYGMQCYDQGNSKSCLGEILPGEWARVYIDNLPDYVKSPNAWRPFITVSYFTKKYGGLTIKWEAHAKHADKWREIDAKFWQIMHERNLLEAP